MSESRYDALTTINLYLVGQWEDLVFVAKSCSTVHKLFPPERAGAKTRLILTLAKGYYSQGEALQEDTKTQLKRSLPMLSDVPKLRKRLEIVIHTRTARIDFFIDTDLLELLHDARIPFMVVLYDHYISRLP